MFQRKNKITAAGVLALILSLSACKKEDAPNDANYMFRNSSYYSINSLLSFDGSSAMDLCQSHSARFKLAGAVRMRKSDDAIGDFTFSNKPGSNILSPCSDWTFQVRMEKLQITADKNGNPVSQWVPQVNNNSIGFIDGACNISINNSVVLDQINTRINVIGEQFPNGQGGDKYQQTLPSMTIQCRQ